MNKILKDAMALTLITLVIGVLLGVVYEVTKEPIAVQEDKAKMEACAEVFPEAESFESLELSQYSDAFRKALDDAGYQAQNIDEVSEALDGTGKLMGYVITVTSTEGYNGDIQFSMGVSLDGTTNGISFLNISETAGLGMNASKDQFKDQFKGKQVTSFAYSKTGAKADNEIDALSGATITTNAVTNGVNAGITAVQILNEGGLDS